MPSVTTVLNTLENIESQWTEFSRRVGDLAGRFEAIAGEDSPALGDLQAVVDDLLDVCGDYPYIAELLKQAEKAPLQPTSERSGSKVPPSLKKVPKPNPKEMANRYYSLVTKLKTTAQRRGNQ